MSTGAALDGFALLATLPALATLDEKSAALAQAASATVACTMATVVVFGDERPQYAHASQGVGFTLRDSSRALRRLLLPTLTKFARAGCFFVPHSAADALTPLSDYKPEGGLLVAALETPDAVLGALVFDVPSDPGDGLMRELRTFADIAAWMIAYERAGLSAEREARQSALIAQINERAQKSLDRQSILESVAQDVRVSFGALRCMVFGREPNSPEYALALACAESAAVKFDGPARVRVAQTWLERSFAGSVVSRDRVGEEDPRDGFVRSGGAGSAIIVPLVIEGRAEHAIVLQFENHDAFDQLDVVMLQAVGSHVGLALANVQLYDSERLRRARAESLERVVRMLRDTQTIEEVMLVFAVTVSHEVKLTCAAYELEGRYATRRAVRAIEAQREGLRERIDAAGLPALLEGENIVQSSMLSASLRAEIFGKNEGLLACLRIDGALWGFIVFSAAPGSHDWNEPEPRTYFHMLASHLELALSGALGFERVQHLARALSESNEFKDDLLAMLAHDFKGPLTVISGYCEVLLENAPPEVHDELDTIYSQTKRLVRLADDAVALAQTQAGGFSLSRARADVRDIVTEAVKSHNRGGARIRLDVPDEPVFVSLDGARFNHVLDNLLMNALKYSELEIDVRLSRAGGKAVIAISDRGIGIPQEELGAIFARFGRASNARRRGISGSGVGLYVSRKIVEVHGGSIAVQSVEGEGSSFYVTLPLAEQP